MKPPKEPKVLVAESHRLLAESLVAALQQDGFELYLAHDGAGALATYDLVRPDVVLVGAGLEGVAGLDVCAELRRRSRVPIVLMTGDDVDVDPVTALDLGVDDVVTDPGRVHELGARLRAVLRRVTAPKPVVPAPPRGGVLEVGDVRLDQAGLEVTVGDRHLDVSLPYFRLLELLVKNAGHVVTRDALARVTGDEPSQPRTVSNQIAHLRALLGPTAAGRERITVVRGRGYVFELPDGVPPPARRRRTRRSVSAAGGGGGAAAPRATRSGEATDAAAQPGDHMDDTAPAECVLCAAAVAAEHGADPWAIARLTTGYVRLNPVQFYPGATLFVLKDCVTELHDLSDPLRDAHLAEMARVAAVLHKTFPVDRLSCEVPSHIGRHLHWWLTPRRVDDPHPGGAIWQNPDFLRRFWSGGADAEAAGRDETRRALCDAFASEGLGIERCFVECAPPVVERSSPVHRESAGRTSSRDLGGM